MSTPQPRRAARWMPRLAAACATLVAGIALAQSPTPRPDDFAFQWPLQARGDSAAWQFALTPEVHAALTDPDLRDFEVFNAAGQAVPVARLDAGAGLLAPGVVNVTLPSYRIPRDPAAPVAAADDLRMRFEIDGQGRLRTLEASATTATAATVATPGATPAVPPPAPVFDVLVDADVGRREGAAPATVYRLDLQWASAQDLNTRVTIDGSDDLATWQPVVPAAALLRLRQGGPALERRRIELPATTWRFLRLRVIEGDALPPSLAVQGLRGRAGQGDAPERALKAALDGDEPNTFQAGGHFYTYTLPASLPVAAVEVQLADDNSTAGMVVDVRQGEAWVPVAQPLAFRLKQGALALQNEAHGLDAPVTAREWRLRSPMKLATPPALVVHYRPHRYVFLAQGAGPYVLAAGSRTARRVELPVSQALRPLQARLGADWMPPVATLGPRREAAGSAAYAEPRTPVDWRGWLLWALLIGGAVVVLAFAVNLLRVRRPG